MGYDQFMRKHVYLILIVLIYLVIGALFVINTPAWQAPDEPAHYNYVRQLAAGRLPVIEAGDYDQEYLTEVVFISGFAPQYSLESIEYEDWQPPLYYLLQTPIYLITGGSLTAMRLFSLLLGAGVIILAYAIVLRLAPDEQWLALTTAVFVAFLPQHIAVLASVNNDALAELTHRRSPLHAGLNRPIANDAHLGVPHPWVLGWIRLFNQGYGLPCYGRHWFGFAVALLGAVATILSSRIPDGCAGTPVGCPLVGTKHRRLRWTGYFGQSGA